MVAECYTKRREEGQGKIKKGPCTYCGGKNHLEKDCRQKKKALKEGKESNEKELLIITEEEEVYILDPVSMSVRCQLKTSKMSSCASGASHVVLLDSFGSVWTAGSC